jgi:hypothetical protein
LKEIKEKISRLEEGTNKVKAKPLKIGHVCYSVDTVRNRADLKNQCICPDGSYGLFLPSDNKNNVNPSHYRTVTILDTRTNYFSQPTQTIYTY